MFFILLIDIAPLISAKKDNPVQKVVELLEDLKAKVEKDGEKEQALYDKYACWCEETLLEKSKAIDDGTALIQKLTQEILALRGKIEELGVTSRQLEQEVVEAKDGINSAKEIREKEREEYITERKEAEQCIGALEAAIKVLAGAGTKKESLLTTIQQAEIISTVADLQSVIKKVPASFKLSKDNMETIRSFVADPSKFLHGFNGAQLHSELSMTSFDASDGKGPFGDYAPASGQIQGILKGMYDSFTGNLEKANEGEATKQKNYKGLMKTKEEEADALEASLDMQKMEKADANKALADSKNLLKDTKEQLAADKEFFAETKQGCKDNAVAWADRSRIRTEELHGMAKAIEILTSDEAKKTFEDAHKELLLQIRNTVKSVNPVKVGRNEINAYERLRGVVKKYPSLRLATIGATIMSGGHFDSVIVMIDKMIRELRQEAEDDEKKREKCDVDKTQLKYAIEDLGDDIKKLDESIERMEAEQEDVEKAIKDKQKEIDETNKTIIEMIEDRQEAHDDFDKALNDDETSISLLQKAIDSLTAVYVNNKMPIPGAALLQTDRQPQAFSKGGYGGSKGESGGIIAILTMIKEDLQAEVDSGKSREEAAQMEFQKQFSDAKALMQKQIEARTALKNQLAQLMADIAIAERKKGRKKDLKGDKQDELDVIDPPCDWVLETFDSRKEKRTAEIDGLMEAKAMLLGATPKKGLVEEKQKVEQKPALFKLPFPQAAPPIPTQSFLQK